MMRTSIALAACLLGGCATVLHGTTERVRIETTPPGAQVFIDGEAMGDTPLETRLDASRGHTLLVRADGHEDAVVTLPTEPIVAYYVLDAIFTLGIGIWVDHSSRAIYGIEDSVHVELAPTSDRTASAPTSANISSR